MMVSYTSGFCACMIILHASMDKIIIIALFIVFYVAGYNALQWLRAFAIGRWPMCSFSLEGVSA